MRPLLAMLLVPSLALAQAKPKTQQSWRSTDIFVVEKTSLPRRVRPVADMLATRHYRNSERWTLVYRRIPRMQTRWLCALEF